MSHTMKPLVKYSYSYQWGLLDDNGDALAKNEQVYLASSVDPRLAALVEALKATQSAIEKFLNDTNAIPPWESAGAIWAQRIKELHAAWLDSKAALAATKEPV